MSLKAELGQSTPTFALIGGAGYIAPRHMKAIKEVGGDLVAVVDPNDSVGILDSYFPDAAFFTDFEEFENYLWTLKESGRDIDYVSITSPNYLHAAHIAWGLRFGCDVICEKPLVLTVADIEFLREVEEKSGKNIYSILQLRLHPAILDFRKKVNIEAGVAREVNLTYVTSRGHWYNKSWKGDDARSGGIATNIGVHFFDMLNFVFGGVAENRLHHKSKTSASGTLRFATANVSWFLSISNSDVPEIQRSKGHRTFRSLECDGESIEFSDGFTDLHTKSYESILAGQGFGLEENVPAITIVEQLRGETSTIK